MIHFARNSFPPDIRIEKEARVLSQAGHRVTVLADRVSEEESSYEEIEHNFFVRRVVAKRPSMVPWLLAHFTLINTEYVSPLSEFVRKDRPDVLHVHDFKLVPSVLKVVKKFNVPVVADLHINIPAAWVAYRSTDPTFKKLIKAILLNYRLWRWH